MPTNVFFNNFESSQEQTLLEDLIIEAVKIYGQDMFYCPRTLDNRDQLYQQSDTVSYNSAHMVEIYIKSIDEWTGDGSFMSRYGLEIRNQAVFSIARRTFQNEVNAEELNEELPRPREGDLIYFPLNRKCFIVRYVTPFHMYYPLGTLPTYDMTVELFEYSSEHLNTGIDDIDSLEVQYSIDMLHWAIQDENGNSLLDESNNFIMRETYQANTIDVFDDTKDIKTESNTFIDFDQIDPFSEGHLGGN